MFTQADRAKIGQKANAAALKEKMPSGVDYDNDADDSSLPKTDFVGAKGTVLTPTDTGWTKVPQPNAYSTREPQGENDVQSRALFQKKKHA